MSHMARRGRPVSDPGGALGAAVRAKRGVEGVRTVGEALGIAGTTIARIERGGRPSYDTAVKLAAWLGWTVEQVMSGSVATPKPGS